MINDKIINCHVVYMLARMRAHLATNCSSNRNTISHEDEIWLAPFIQVSRDTVV